MKAKNSQNEHLKIIQKFIRQDFVNEIIYLVEEALEGGFTAKEIGESIFTEGETESELKANIKHAVDFHFDANEISKTIRMQCVKDEVFAV